MDGTIGAVTLAVIVASLSAAVGSLVNQARRGEHADPRRPWRWLLLFCTLGLALTITMAMGSGWSVGSAGAVVPFVALTPLTLAGSTGALWKRRADEP